MILRSNFTPRNHYESGGQIGAVLWYLPSLLFMKTAEQGTYKMNSYFFIGEARACIVPSRQIPRHLGLLERGTLGSSVEVVVELVLAVIDLALRVLELVVIVVVAVFDPYGG